VSWGDTDGQSIEPGKERNAMAELNHKMPNKGRLMRVSSCLREFLVEHFMVYQRPASPSKRTSNSCCLRVPVLS